MIKTTLVSNKITPNLKQNCMIHPEPMEELQPAAVDEHRFFRKLNVGAEWQTSVLQKLAPSSYGILLWQQEILCRLHLSVLEKIYTKITACGG